MVDFKKELESKTKKELIELAKKSNLSGYSKLRKSELMGMILEKYENHNRNKVRRFVDKIENFSLNHQHTISFSQLLLAILTIGLAIYGFYRIETVFIRTKPELGFCPSVHSGTQCSSNDVYVCGDMEEIIKWCDNDGHFDISAEIFNKGLTIALDIELEVKMIGAEAKFSEDSLHRINPYTSGLVSLYKNNEKTNEHRIFPINGVFSLSQGIHTLESSKSKRIRFYFPEDFGFFVRPEKVEFILKENGVVIDKKVIIVNYEKAIREKCSEKKSPSRPFPVSGIIKSNQKPLESAKVTIKNIQTWNEMEFMTLDDGSYSFDLSNFDTCWRDNDAIQIIACSNMNCKEEKRIIKDNLDSMEIDIDLT